MTPSRRVFSFARGPAVLPEPVLRQAQAELLDWGGRGFSVMETSHCTDVAVMDETEALLRTWLAVPDSYRVLFMHDGGHQQFAMGPRNLLDAKFHADDILSGHLPACRH
jgi:phosphoserine aminotransferase